MNTYNDTTTADAVKREALAAEQARAAQYKRDRFEAAKAAMQGLLAHYGTDCPANALADNAVHYGDWLLEELSKCPTG